MKTLNHRRRQWFDGRPNALIGTLLVILFFAQPSFVIAQTASEGTSPSGISSPNAEQFPTAEQPTTAEGSPAAEPMGEIRRDPLAGLVRASTEKPPTEAGFRIGLCWLAAYWLGVGVGWWWRRRETVPALKAFGAVVLCLHLFNGAGQTLAGCITFLYALILGRCSAMIGGRTGRYLLIWAGLLAAPVIFAGTPVKTGAIPMGELVFIPVLVHFVMVIMMGWPILLVGGLKRGFGKGMKALLQPASDPQEKTRPPEMSGATGCFGALGFLGCFLAAINVLGLLVGATPIRGMLAAPEITFEEFRKNPHALKYARVKGCPLALPEASFELARGERHDGESLGKEPVLSKLLIPLAGLVSGKPASSPLLLSSIRKSWRQLYIRAYSPKVDLKDDRFRFQPREMMRYDRFIDEHRPEFYPVEDLLIEVAAAPTPRWSTEPIRIPFDSYSEGFERPRPGGLLEPYVEVIDRGPSVASALVGWAMSFCFIGGWLIWWKEP